MGFRLTSAASENTEDILRTQHSIQTRISTEIPEAVSRFALLPDEALIAASTMRELFDVRGNASLWRMERAGRIPRSRRLPGSQHRRWIVGEVRAFLKAIAVFEEADYAPA